MKAVQAALRAPTPRFYTIFLPTLQDYTDNGKGRFASLKSQDITASSREDMLKTRFCVAATLLIGLLMTGCGNGPNSGNINGTWTAKLTNPDGTPAFAFTTNFTEMGNGTLDVTNLSFTSANSCFASQKTTATGSFGLAGNFNGNVSGTFGMTVSTSETTPNVLKLQGTVTGNVIAGTWTLSGSSGCSGNGAFTMNKS